MEEAKLQFEKTRNFNFHLALIKIKGIVSSLIFIMFVPVGISGIGLYFAPSGRQSRLISWTFFGISRSQLQAMHDVPGIILTVLFVIHMILNFRIYFNEVKCLVRFKK